MSVVSDSCCGDSGRPFLSRIHNILRSRSASAHLCWWRDIQQKYSTNRLYDKCV